MSENIQDIQKRKEELRKEIRELQDELDQSIDEARTDLTTQLKPRNLIKKYPLTSLGVTFIAGVLLGRGGSKSKTTRNDGEDVESSDQYREYNGIGKHLWSELKRTATKRAVRLLMDYLDDMLETARKGSSDKNKRDD